MANDHPLKAYRAKRGISQNALAEELGVSEMAVFRWETGARKIAQSRLSEIAEKTGIPAVDLRPDLAALFADAAQ